MAQTRAVGKAYRMKIGWLLKVAGYETTPAEEMDAVQQAEVVEKPKPRTSVRDVSYAVDKLQQASSLDELKRTYAGFTHDIMIHPEVVKKKDELKEKLANRVVTADRGGEEEEAPIGG